MSTKADTRIAGVILVDAHGRLLLRLCDANTRIDPDSWYLPDGRVDDAGTSLTPPAARHCPRSYTITTIIGPTPPSARPHRSPG
ncbi:hypothetical protein [Actinoplanes sp. NPDC020271]|uniref:hypothetical protein n=1 Tax=Actinoplanes sp. NPDC020271 TaxID=3363896 RepID=UPI0037B9E463